MSIKRTGNSYVFGFPKITSGNTSVESHYSFHIGDNRITNKITDISSNDMDFNKFREVVKGKKGFSVTPEDVEAGNTRYVSEKDIRENLIQITSLAINWNNLEFIKKAFLRSETLDNQFPKVVRFNLPKEHRTSIMRIFVSKDLKSHPYELVCSCTDDPIHDSFILNDGLNGDIYTFIISVHFSKKSMAGYQYRKSIIENNK